jgi:hypothetical protein
VRCGRGAATRRVHVHVVEGVYQVTRSECGGWVRTMTPVSRVTCMCRSELLLGALCGCSWPRPAGSSRPTDSADSQ